MQARHTKTADILLSERKSLGLVMMTRPRQQPGAERDDQPMFEPTKPCPFCASTNVRIEELDAGNHKEYAVMCCNCGAFGPNDLGKSGAVEMWDLRRVEDKGNNNAS